MGWLCVELPSGMCETEREISGVCNCCGVVSSVRLLIVVVVISLVVVYAIRSGSVRGSVAGGWCVVGALL
jgi:hypothetical protein